MSFAVGLGVQASIMHSRCCYHLRLLALLPFSCAFPPVEPSTYCSCYCQEGERACLAARPAGRNCPVVLQRLSLTASDKATLGSLIHFPPDGAVSAVTSSRTHPAMVSKEPPYNATLTRLVTVFDVIQSKAEQLGRSVHAGISSLPAYVPEIRAHGPVRS